MANVLDDAYQQITDLSAPTALTVPDGATGCLIQAEAQTIRMSVAGTVPTGVVGLRISAGDSFSFRQGEVPLETISLIEEVAGGIANVIYLP